MNQLFYNIAGKNVHQNLPKKPCVRSKNFWQINFKTDFQSVLRRLGVCFCFCFEFIEMLHFGDSIHEVFESAITVHFVSRISDELKRRFEIASRFFYLFLFVLQGYLALIMKKTVSLSRNF